MSKLPQVSVYMPVWNMERFIEKAIESVLDQTFQDFELVIVDDGSTDKTPNLVKDIKSSKIRFFQKDHGGLADSKNFAKERCKGEYLVQLDADDEFCPTILEQEVEILSRYPEISAVYTDYLRISENGEEVETIRYEEFDTKTLIHRLFVDGKNPIPGAGTMERRWLFQRSGGHNPKLLREEDYEYVAKIARYARFYHIRSPLYKWRQSLRYSRESLEERCKGTYFVLKFMLDEFQKEELFPDVPWQELSTRKGAVEFHSRVSQVFLKHGLFYGTLVSSRHIFKEALFHLRKVLEIEPGNQDARVSLGLIYMKFGDLMKAVDVFSNILKTHPNNQNARDLLQKCYNALEPSLKMKTYDPRAYWEEKGRYFMKAMEGLVDRKTWEIDGLIKRHLQEVDFKKVLEVGCGYGKCMEVIKRYFPNVHLVGVDISLELLKNLRQFLNRPSSVSVANALSLPFKDNMFDVVFTHGLFIHIPHDRINDCIREVMRVARIGLFIESSKGQDTLYYFSHDYLKLFQGLGFMCEIRERYDPKNNGQVIFVRKPITLNQKFPV
jgi:glycosyltransferase involved in cell wall biosynthesis